MNHAFSTSPCLGADTAAAYATRNLEVTEARRVDAHIARCGPCRRRLSDLARVLTSASVSPASGGVTEMRSAGGLLQRGDGIGRYVVAEPLGAGGMGVVYAARDPQLHRRVALKMVRGGVSGEPKLQERLLREAQAMARLSHPNVVAVHDLVVVEGRLYVAMEIVDGVSLKAWLRAESRTFRAILHAFVQAGRGLAAAHAAGLVHRDFKPANVLCGALGRVCVTDFGLAQSAAASPGAGASADRTSAMPIRGPARSGVSIRTGPVEGTPAYMAPEQHRGELADARSDQFSFCVALHEALFKQLPFTGETAEAQADAKMKGRFRSVSPARVRVPSRVRKALERGMSADPALRHPSMEALLTALTTDRRPVAFGVLAALAVVAVAATLTLRARHEQSERRQACTASASKVAAVWNGARRKAASDAFGAIPGGYAQAAWRGVNEALDRYADKWVTLRTETCEKALGEMPVASLPTDGRMVCFDERLRDLDALVAELPRIDSVGAAATAVVAADTLEPASSCNRARSTTRTRHVSGDGAKADGLRRDLARAKVLRYLGKSGEAAAAVARLRETAESLHDDALLAQVLLEASISDRVMRKLDAAEDEGFRAATLADAIGDDALRAKAWATLLGFYGSTQQADDKAVAHSYAQAMAAVARLADGAELEALVRGAHSKVLWRGLKAAEARDEARRAVDIYERTENRLELALTLNLVAVAEGDLGNLDAARTAALKALDGTIAVLGPHHPSVSLIETDLAFTRLNAMDYAEAIEMARRARFSREAAGDTSPRAETELAASLVAEAGALIGSGRQAEALPLLERVLAVVDREGPSSEDGVWEVLSAFGRAYVELGQPERALPYLERAIASKDKIPPEVRAEIEFSLAKALTDSGRDPNRGRALGTEASALLDREATLAPYSAKARDQIHAWLAAAPAMQPKPHRRRSASR